MGDRTDIFFDSQMASASNVLGGIVLIVAGVYQWTPLKDICLAGCQSPFRFLMRHGGFRGDLLGSLLLGLCHGAYCVGCCWVLMALLFVGGVMNVIWIALLALLVLLEKLTPIGLWIARSHRLHIHSSVAQPLKTMKTRARVIDFLSCISYTGTSYPDWVSS